MRRLSAVLLAGAILTLPAFSQSAFAQDAATQKPATPPPQKTTYNGDAVMIAYAINPGKEADYEQVLAKLKAGLEKSPRPEAKQQLAGWKVIKNDAKQADGSSVYVHIISPIVPDADYSITNIVYETASDEEKRAFYDLYKGALMKGIFQISGPIPATFK
jgi:hypothetical protein